MDVNDWQANRIRNSRYLQQEVVKPWPWGIQVQMLGAAGSGRHSLLSRICLDTFVGTYSPFGTDRDSGCKQAKVRGLPCSVWLEAPLALTSFGAGFPLAKREHFAYVTHGIRDCDALMLVFDLTSPRSFQVLCEFCARCELEGVGVSPGTSLPCLVVGTKSDVASPGAVENGERLARRLGGQFVACSAKTGDGLDALVELAVGPVIEARTKLMRESEETLGEAIRTLMARTAERRTKLLRRRLLKGGWGGAGGGWGRRAETRGPGSRSRCSGAPPRWTMRRLMNPPAVWSASNEADMLQQSRGGSGTARSSSTIVPCPPEFQLSVDLVEPAATDWAPKF